LNYIVDFVCLPLRLVIELDGYTHQFEEVYQRDVIREDHLVEVGFKVLRFHDKEVFRDIKRVEQVFLFHVE